MTTVLLILIPIGLIATGLYSRVKKGSFKGRSKAMLKMGLLMFCLVLAVVLYIRYGVSVKGNN